MVSKAIFYFIINALEDFFMAEKFIFNFKKGNGKEKGLVIAAAACFLLSIPEMIMIACSVGLIPNLIVFLILDGLAITFFLLSYSNQKKRWLAGEITSAGGAERTETVVSEGEAAEAASEETHEEEAVEEVHEEEAHVEEASGSAVISEESDSFAREEAVLASQGYKKEEPEEEIHEEAHEEVREEPREEVAREKKPFAFPKFLNWLLPLVVYAALFITFTILAIMDYVEIINYAIENAPHLPDSETYLQVYQFINTCALILVGSFAFLACLIVMLVLVANLKKPYRAVRKAPLIILLYCLAFIVYELGWIVFTILYNIEFSANVPYAERIGYTVTAFILMICSIVSMAMSKSFSLAYKIVNAVVFVFAAVFMFILGGALIPVGIFYILAGAIPFFMTKTE